MARLYISRRLKSRIDDWPFLDGGLRLLEGGLVRVVIGMTRRLPLERASDAGEWIGRQLGPRLRKHRHVLTNLRIAFPERDEAWIAQTATAVWGQIGRVLAEYPHLPTIVAERRVELATGFDLDRLRRSRTGFIFVGMHQANWNLLAVGGQLGGFDLSVVNRRQINPSVEDLIAQFRDQLPCEVVDVDDLPRRMIATLEQGRSIGLLIDHRIDRGELVPFCGFPAPTTTVPARMAAKLGTALVPARLERLPGVRFRLTLGEPIYSEPGQRPRQAAATMTGAVHTAFEAWIRSRPADWCCVKRRWPKDLEPAIERNGSARYASQAAVPTAVSCRAPLQPAE